MAKHIHIHLHRGKARDTKSEAELRREFAAAQSRYASLPTNTPESKKAYEEMMAAHRALHDPDGSKDAGFTKYDPREATRLDDEIKDIQQQITAMKSKKTVPAYQLQDLERTLEKLRKERAKYHTNPGDAARDSKLEDLERQLDELETQIEKLEDAGQSPSRAQLDKRKSIQQAIAVIKSARKTAE